MILLPEVFEVWLCRFIFADKPSVKKIRPAVILEANHEKLVVIFAKITSHLPRSTESGEVAISDLEIAGLLKPSTIRCSQIVEATYDDLIKPLGILSDNDKQAMIRGLVEAGYLV